MKFLRVCFYLLCSTLFAQHSDPSSLPPLKDTLNGNNLNVTFQNDGAISGFTTGVDVRGLWKGNYYIGDVTPMIGLELLIKDYTDDGENDTIHSVIISRGPRSHQSEERHPLNGSFWGFNPVLGYTNMNLPIWAPAVSSKPETWPSSWPDHPEYGNNVWNGLLGPYAIPNSLEAYFVIDDFWDTETNMIYNYHSDENDYSFTGNGIVTSVRYIQLNEESFDDIIFRVYDIKYMGKQTYNKVVCGTITGSLI